MRVLKKIKNSVLYSASPEICMDVADWAKLRGLPVTELHPPLLADFVKYADQDLVVKNEIAAHRNALERSQTLVPIEGVIVRDGDGIVELPDGQICYEGNWWLGYLKSNPTYCRRFEWRRRALKGDYFSLISLWSSTYYHWFHDVLPRLHTSLPFLPKTVRFLINENPKEYQIQSLKAFGVGEERLETQPSRINTKIERLWFSSPLGHTGLTSGPVLKEVANKIVSYYGSSLPPSQGQAFYISRSKAGSRRITNEKDLKPILDRYQLHLTNSEDSQFLQQVSNFLSARIIVAPHGAGLTNTIFCSKDSSVGEITCRGLTGCHYLLSCKNLGIFFQRFYADPAPHQECSDMLVDPISFDKWLCVLKMKAA